MWLLTDIYASQSYFLVFVYCNTVTLNVLNTLLLLFYCTAKLVAEEYVIYFAVGLTVICIVIVTLSVYLLPHPPTYSLIHLPTPSTTHLLPHPPTYSLIHLPTPSSTYLLPHPPTYSLNHPPTPSTTYLLPQPPTYSLIHPPTPSSTHLLPHPPTYSLIHLPTPSSTYLLPHPLFLPLLSIPLLHQHSCANTHGHDNAQDDRQGRLECIGDHHHALHYTTRMNAPSVILVTMAQYTAVRLTLLCVYSTALSYCSVCSIGDQLQLSDRCIQCIGLATAK